MWAKNALQLVRAHPEKLPRRLRPASLHGPSHLVAVSSSRRSDRCWCGAGCRSWQMTATFRDWCGWTRSTLCCAYRGVTARVPSGTRIAARCLEPGPNTKVCNSKLLVFSVNISTSILALTQARPWRVYRTEWPSQVTLQRARDSACYSNLYILMTMILTTTYNNNFLLHLLYPNYCWKFVIQRSKVKVTRSTYRCPSAPLSLNPLQLPSLAIILQL